MGIFIIWIIFSFIVASLGSNRRIGFWGALFCSLILSPLIGLIVTLFSKDIADEKHKQEMLQATRQSNGHGLASELERLATLRDKGIISSIEFEDQKRKLLR
jgi:Short C-terminal domain